MYAFEDDTRIRPQTTEIALRMRAGKGLTVTAYSDITVEATRIIPVWTGSAWVEQPTRKAVWAFCDLVRAEYGLDAISGADADKALYYANLLSENDTFDGQLPEVSSFWEAASEILHPLRADPVKVGAIHSFVRDESRAEPRHVLTRRQIVRDSGGATFKTKVEGGDVIVEFDRDGDPKRPDEARFSYGTPSRTPKRYRVNGITTGAHAQKHATWLAAVAVFRGAERKVTTEWDGRLVYPGDHVLSDLWFFRGKDAYGVAARAGNVLTLDVTANVPADAWGYGSIRTRAGREWGILRVKGVGPRGLQLHPDDVVALQAQTGRLLGDVLASDTQDPTTVVLGELDELQETYVARSAIPSDADHVQIEMVQDDARVWQLLDEAVIAPAPVNADNLAEPLVPEIAVLHARCVRIETGIEVVWGASTTRGARNYEADISYDGGGTREVLSPFGPASSGRAPMRQVEGPVTVRARAYGRTGLPGAWKSATFTTVAPVVDGSQTEIINLPPIDYAGLTEAVRGRLDHILEVEAYAQAVAVEAKADFTAALARAEDVRAQAQADFQEAAGRADAALAKALESLGNDTANAAAITSEAQARLTADEAMTSRIDVAVSRIDGNTAAIIEEASTRATAVEAEARRTTALIAQTDSDRAYFLNEQTARITQDEAFASDLTAVGVRLGSNEASILSESRVRADADSAQATRIDGLTATVGQNSAGLIEERQIRVDADSALSLRIDSFSATVGGNTAAIVEERRVRAEADSANALRSENLESYVFGENTPGSLPQTRASILSEAQTRANADSAQATRIDGLSARVGTNEASIIEERSVRADADSANTRYIQSIESAVGGNYNLLLTEQTTRATQDEAITGYVSYVESVVGSNYGQFIDERTTRVNAESALSQRIESTLSTVGYNYGLLVDETTTRANADSALSQRIIDAQARSDAGTATGRFSLLAQSGPSGVSARIQALVAVQSGGQTRGAGYYVEVMDDGTSRFVVDASAFYITANGQSMPTFSFDGYTLTIPSLRVTQQAILPGAAVDPKKSYVENYTIPALTGDTWTEVPGSEVYFTVDHANGFPVVATVYANLYVQLTNGSTTLQQATIETAIAINGNAWNNRNTVFVSTTAGNQSGFQTSSNANSGGTIGNTMMGVIGPPGTHRLSVVYKFKGPNSGAGARINACQIDALISKR
ncbi:host specificity factor TipJ family phage tail protein [Methylobacterium sp.]|uniref:host specificity factor TipJ family phage tail protein n=1 Tax=Methylobacterium sp. TaxID=409 RepID=UPI0025E42555|nr:host specificity factor TipJ family phage tail protein [Methylobacterium sp.]MBY0258998.1 hypothetical protein [Methylobacterium sp.]